MKRNSLLIIGSIILISTALVLVNWYLIPSSRAWGLWWVIGSSIGAASLFVYGFVAAVAALNGLNKRSPKEDLTVLTSQLPESDRNFTGRLKELQELHAQYSKVKINVLSIHGMGGLGKTTLAITFSDQIAGHFDHHLFLDMQGLSDKPVTGEEAMHHIVRSFNPSFSGDGSLLAGAYRSIVNKTKVLLLLDNVSGEDQIQDFILPAGSVLIFTSRTKFSIPHSFSLNLPYMSEPEARELLLKITDRPTVEEANHIIGLCGYLPNAIVKAGKSLREYPNLGTRRYIAELSQANARVGMIEATTSLSFNLLDAPMRKYWSELSIFPGDFGLEGASRVLECDPEACEDVLFHLYKLSLVNVFVYPSTQFEQGETRFRLHDLDRVFASSKLKDKERRIVELRFAEYYTIVISNLNMWFASGGKDMLVALEAFDKEWKNIELAQALAKRYYKTNENAANYCLALSLNGMRIMDTRFPQELLIDWSQTALRAARRQKDVVGEEKALSNLGTAMSNAGRLDESTPFLSRSIEMAHARGNPKGEIESIGNLANVYRRKGDFQKALEYHTQAYEIAKDKGYLDVQSSELLNIGNVYSDLTEFDKAREHYSRAIDLARTIQDLNVEANGLYNTAASYARQQKIIKALKYFRLASPLATKLGAKNLQHSILLFYSALFDRFGIKILAKKYLRDANKILGI